LTFNFRFDTITLSNERGNKNMKNTNEKTDRVMKGILSRVLSQELAHQKIWGEQEEREMGYNHNREAIIADIKTWMTANGIEFRADFYYDEIEKYNRN
jgi:hypothetical protein